MDYDAFYLELFQPLEQELGPVDASTVAAIVGFDMGGPLNFSTFGYDGPIERRAYVSCELAVRSEQQPSERGRFELLVHCGDEQWVRSVLSDIGRMTLDVAFDDGHSLDIGPWLEPDASIQGVTFERACTATIGGSPFCVLRVIGVTRLELEFAQEHGAAALHARLRKAGVYPAHDHRPRFRRLTLRRSVIDEEQAIDIETATRLLSGSRNSRCHTVRACAMMPAILGS